MKVVAFYQKKKRLKKWDDIERKPNEVFIMIGNAQKIIFQKFKGILISYFKRVDFTITYNCLRRLKGEATEANMKVNENEIQNLCNVNKNDDVRYKIENCGTPSPKSGTYLLIYY